MDNDRKIIKILKQMYKKMQFGLSYYDLDVLPNQVGNELIRTIIEEGNPAFVARGGATELRCISEYLQKKSFSEKIKRETSELSGIFPNDSKTLERFCELYMSEMESADVVALWGVGAESRIVHSRCNNAKFTMLHALEPYYFDRPWSEALLAKKVLVVHPFKKSILEQYKRREQIFPEKEVLPKLQSLECIQAVQSIAGEKTAFNSWFDALEYMENEIYQKDFDIAIIGAGAYGLPLAAYCKKIGKQAIQMSGATQLMFGIKGKRWDEHPIISKFYNDAWIRPDRKETPAQKQKVEGGSYW